MNLNNTSFIAVASRAVIGILVLTFSVPLFCGCCLFEHHAQPAQIPGREAPVNAAILDTDNAIAKVDQKREEQLESITKIAGIIKAEVEDAKEANRSNPAGAGKMIVDLNLQVVTNYLAYVPADNLEREYALERRRLLTIGDTNGLLAKYDFAMTNADTGAAQLNQLDQQARQLQSDLDAARENEKIATQKYISDAKASQQAHQEEIDKLKKELTDQVRKKQVWFLSIGGILLIALFGVGLGFGGVAGAKISWPLGVIGLLFLGLAQIVSQPWFMWACLVVTLIGLSLLAWWIWSHYQLGNLKQSLDQKSTQMKGALGDVIPVLDNAYNNADQMTKDFLDKIIFDKLAAKMDSSTKGVIHQVRADIATVPSNLPE